PYSARRPARAAWAATSSRSVDLPTPGSPASSTTPPETSPPPSTRSSSPTPVGRAVEPAPSTSAIGRAAAVTGPGDTWRSRGGSDASRVPQAWHSPQRPVQRTACQPHSEQRYVARPALRALPVLPAPVDL